MDAARCGGSGGRRARGLAASRAAGFASADHGLSAPCGRDRRRRSSVACHARRRARGARPRRHGVDRARTRRPRALGARGWARTPARRRGFGVLDRPRMAARYRQRSDAPALRDVATCRPRRRGTRAARRRSRPARPARGGAHRRGCASASGLAGGGRGAHAALAAARGRRRRRQRDGRSLVCGRRSSRAGAHRRARALARVWRRAGGRRGAPRRVARYEASITTARRLVITVCPRERGVVVLPLERGGRARRLDAAGVLTALQALVAARGLTERVQIRDGCAGGCWGAGPNVDVRIYAAAAPGERADHVALGWKTYVYSLPTLVSLADVIDENLRGARATRRTDR